MEKTISSEARYQRAMELYERKRNVNSDSILEAPQKVSSKKTKSKKNRIKKISIQLLISFLLYISIIGIQNSENEFLKLTLSKTKEMLFQDIKIEGLYQTIIKYVGENILPQDNNEDTKEEIEQNEEQQVNENEPVLDASYIRVKHEEIASSFNVMFDDTKYIKDNFKLQKPLDAIISSRFGQRVQTSIEVTPYHSGTDFAAEKNTNIYSIMEGTVTYVSLVGTYGKHVIVKNNDVTVLYAHCNEILVKERWKNKKRSNNSKGGSNRVCNGKSFAFRNKKGWKVS